MKKKFLLLGASLLSFGLIGGTFALWAVTDKADPLNIGISPGSVSSDETTQFVTLEWGSQKSLANVSNLKRGEVRKAGVLDLLAISDDEENYTGTLKVSLSHGNAHGQTLINNYLHVDVYQGNLTATDNVIAAETITANAGKKVAFTTGQANLQVVNTPVGAEASAIEHNVYTVAVYLDSEMTLSQYDELSDAQVTATFNWDRNEDTKVDQYTLYAKGFDLTGADGMYAYAFGANDNQNAPWPGVKMEETNIPGVYQANIPTSYTTVIFNNGKEATTPQQSADLAIASKFTGTNNRFTYTGSGTDYGSIDHFNPDQEKVYYVVGTGLTVGGKAITWDVSNLVAEAKMTVSGENATLNGVTAVEGAEFKIYETASGNYYPTGDNWLITSELAGTVNISYHIGGLYGSDVTVNKVSA